MWKTDYSSEIHLKSLCHEEYVFFEKKFLVRAGKVILNEGPSCSNSKLRKLRSQKIRPVKPTNVVGEIEHKWILSGDIHSLPSYGPKYVLFVSEEKRCPIPLKYKDVVRQTEQTYDHTISTEKPRRSSSIWGIVWRVKIPNLTIKIIWRLQVGQWMTNKKTRDHKPALRWAEICAGLSKEQQNYEIGRFQEDNFSVSKARTTRRPLGSNLKIVISNFSEIQKSHEHYKCIVCAVRVEGDWRRAIERKRQFLAIGRNGHSITDCKLREGKQMSTSSDKKVLCPNSKLVRKINQVLSQSSMKIPDGKVLETKNEEKDAREVHCAFHCFMLFTSPRAPQPLPTEQRTQSIERRQREIRWSLWSGFHTTMSMKLPIGSRQILWDYRKISTNVVPSFAQVGINEWCISLSQSSREVVSCSSVRVFRVFVGWNFIKRCFF